jgi:phosphatidylserine/phosphatidylglycerophosphate/cardiolipin synthase-like enzyme
MQSMKSNLLFASVALALLGPTTAHAGLLGSWIGEPPASTLSAASGGTCRPEAGFSPEGSASRLVDHVIDSAQHSIRLAAYSFTSADVVRRLINAKQRGVDVAVIVDEKNNLVEDRSGRARAALNLLVNAGIPTRTINVYPIHHDKYMVIDGKNVETGSFNYSAAAATRNSENALVLWDCPLMAEPYLNHWQSRWPQAADFHSNY